MKALATIALLVLLTGCDGKGVTSSTVRPDVDYGPQPDPVVAEALAKGVMQGVLKDPFSAHWSCNPLYQGQLGDHAGFGLGTAMTGWILPCDINAKNDFGAYGGNERYLFVITGGAVGRVMWLTQTENGVPTERIVYNAPR